MDQLVRMLKGLADPTRLRIAQVLVTRDELCVCEIVDALAVPQYTASRHLGILKAAGIVDDWRQGKWTHYRLSEGLSPGDRAVIAAVAARAKTDDGAKQDLTRLERHLRPRVNGEVVACKT
jgi:ArsR family transcriptional regulator